jgi:hypothetical protein
MLSIESQTSPKALQLARQQLIRSTRRHIMRFMKRIPAFLVLLVPPRLYPRIMCY